MFDWSWWKNCFFFDFSIFFLIVDVFLFLIDDVDLSFLSRILCELDEICDDIIVSIDWITDTNDSFVIVFLRLLISSKNALYARNFFISRCSKSFNWLNSFDTTIDFELSSNVFIDFVIALLTMMYCCFCIANLVDVIENWYLIRSIFFCFFLHFFFHELCVSSHTQHLIL